MIQKIKQLNTYLQRLFTQESDHDSSQDVAHRKRISC